MGKECQCSCLWYPGSCPGAAHILWSLSATFRELKTPTGMTREGISTYSGQMGFVSEQLFAILG